MRKYLLFLLVLLLTFPVAGQESDTENSIELVPFMSMPLNIQGVRPDGWRPQVNADGVYVRGDTLYDLTAIIMQAQESTKDEFIDSLILSFGTTELTVVDTFDSDFMSWEIYQTTREQNDQHLLIDVAVAENEADGRVYYVLLQADETLHDDLYVQVFVPALTGLSSIQFYEEPEGRFSVPVPVTWEVTQADGFAQIAHVSGEVVIMVSAVESSDPITSAENSLSMINPEFDQIFNPEQHLLRVIDDPARVGNLEAVYLIDWVDSGLPEANGFFLQTVSRVYDDVVYMTAVIGNINTVANYETDIALIDNNLTITALEEAMGAEATVEAEE